MWRSNNWMLHHDNAPVHRSSLVSDFLENHDTVTVPQPPYSSDLAPADYFLFLSGDRGHQERIAEGSEGNSEIGI